MMRATAGDETVGMHLWYQVDDTVYSHLAAFSPKGYELLASYAIYWHSIDHFKKGARWLHLGAGIGITGREDDGLSRFKRGWATDTRTAYFCGRVFDRQRYNKIIRMQQVPPTTYFPAYRSGEFGE